MITFANFQVSATEAVAQKKAAGAGGGGGAAAADGSDLSGPVALMPQKFCL